MISFAILEILRFLVLDLELLYDISFLSYVNAMLFNMFGFELYLLIRFIGLKGDFESVRFFVRYGVGCCLSSLLLLVVVFGIFLDN